MIDTLAHTTKTSKLHEREDETRCKFIEFNLFDTTFNALQS